ncbi:MAG TPA: glycerophosphodiester phosphodiesterase family protein [Propionibacteriaceae bacterium]|nr:glycerophosphodiester phosphodiesterase family protein [Propionibacteriaceae bacterium]
MHKFLARTITVLAVTLITLPLLNLGAHAVTYPTLVGHRGVGDPWTVELGIPEQSIPAIQWAAQNHADIVEGDISVTRDSKMVMMHDVTIDRTTNRTGRVRDRDLSYITGAWLEIPVDKDGNGNFDNTSYHPPSFRSWLKAAKATGKLVFVELKGDGWTKSQVKRYVDEVAAQGMKSKVITAGGETRLSYFRSYSSGARSWSVGHFPSTTKVKSVAGASGYATISLAIAEDNIEYVQRLQAAGIKVLVYTLDNAYHYKRALPVGAYGWMCDNTADAHAWLNQHMTG